MTHPAAERLARVSDQVYSAHPESQFRPSPLQPHHPGLQAAAADVDTARQAWEEAVADFGLAEAAALESLRAIDTAEQVQDIAEHAAAAEQRTGLAEAVAVIVQRRENTYAAACRHYMSSIPTQPDGAVRDGYIGDALSALQPVADKYSRAVADLLDARSDLIHATAELGTVLGDPGLARRLNAVLDALPEPNREAPRLARSRGACQPAVLRAILDGDEYSRVDSVVIHYDARRQATGHTPIAQYAAGDAA